ncbi:hypothetical protein M426DRAFT_27115 [Hypoxylon sp. CI-4A]|nr:hypothetical protein M426DRAFT_27115 [Hypoxylon sp. CI-4A]
MTATSGVKRIPEQMRMDYGIEMIIRAEYTGQRKWMRCEGCAHLDKRSCIETEVNHAGEDFSDRCKTLKNLLCRHLWRRDFDGCQDRWSSYRATFAYPYRTYYFLLDHAVEQPIPHPILAELKRRPFYQLQPRNVARTGVSLYAASKRQIIRTRLRSNMKIPKGEIEFLRTPDQAQLLKEEVDPMF